MFKKKQRLNSRQFSKIKKRREKYFNYFFCIYFIKNLSLGVSVVVSKKTLKKRIFRNKEKRRIIHILKEYIPINITYNIIIWTIKDTSILNYKQLKKEIKHLLKKTKILL